MNKTDNNISHPDLLSHINPNQPNSPESYEKNGKAHGFKAEVNPDLTNQQFQTTVGNIEIKFSDFKPSDNFDMNAHEFSTHLKDNKSKVEPSQIRSFNSATQTTAFVGDLPEKTSTPTMLESNVGEGQDDEDEFGEREGIIQKHNELDSQENKVDARIKEASEIKEEIKAKDWKESADLTNILFKENAQMQAIIADTKDIAKETKVESDQFLTKEIRQSQMDEFLKVFRAQNDHITAEQFNDFDHVAHFIFDNPEIPVKRLSSQEMADSAQLMTSEWAEINSNSDNLDKTHQQKLEELAFRLVDKFYDKGYIKLSLEEFLKLKINLRSDFTTFYSSKTQSNKNEEPKTPKQPTSDLSKHHITLHEGPEIIPRLKSPEVRERYLLGLELKIRLSIEKGRRDQELKLKQEKSEIIADEIRHTVLKHEINIEDINKTEIKLSESKRIGSILHFQLSENTLPKKILNFFLSYIVHKDRVDGLKEGS